MSEIWIENWRWVHFCSMNVSVVFLILAVFTSCETSWKQKLFIEEQYYFVFSSFTTQFLFPWWLTCCKNPKIKNTTETFIEQKWTNVQFSIQISAKSCFLLIFFNFRFATSCIKIFYEPCIKIFFAHVSRYSLLIT